MTPPLTPEQLLTAEKQQREEELAKLHHWNQLLFAARDSQAADLKAAATKWAGYIATLVGVVGSISIIVAPKALADFSSSKYLTITLVSLSVAGIAGFIAVLLAISAAGAWPRIDSTMDASRYETWVKKTEVYGVKRLCWSRWLTLLAILGVVVGSALSVIDTLTAPSSNVNVAVVHKDGSATCGPLGASIGKEASALSITVVPHC